MLIDQKTDSRSFPADPPADPDDPESILGNDWTAFTTLQQMGDHWDRPGWPPGHRAYYWMLLPHSPQLTALTRHCQDHLAPFALDLVPDDGLHITMAKIGNRTDVATHRLDALARTVAADPPPAFDVLAHPLTGSRGAVRYSLTPWSPLICVHAALTQATRQHGLPGGRPTTGFRPHLGIGYHNRHRAARPLIDAVAELRGLRPALLRAERVDLVELRRENAGYRWDVLHTVPLAPLRPDPAPGRTT
ncbi:2'-5' RNA ligase family protein [Streptomyces sp. NPDC000594]|uniref:2'-5' RNA ligase family protein n=1 Tax=Streptomyces sp. NPDC000594 TaxID=3154261 RepID=UPI0033308549